MSGITTDGEIRHFDGFLNHLRQRGRKDKTLASYTSAHRVLCDYYAKRDGHPWEWNTLTGLDLRTWKGHALKAGANPSSVNHRLVFAKAYMRWLNRAGHVPREQLESITSTPEIQVPHMGARVLEPDEFRRFLRNVELSTSKRDKALIYLLLCGLREGEVVGLNRADITLNAARGSVRVQGEHVKGSAARVVPLTRQARIHLQAYFSSGAGDGALFSGERGPLTESGVYKLVRRYGEQVGIAMWPHRCRHQFSEQYLLENQGDLVGLQALLGHAQLDTTARFYARRRMSALEANVEKINI